MQKRKSICDNCGKGVQHANLLSHAKNRVKTIKRPNLHRATVLKGGKKVKVKLCTKCLRRADRPSKKIAEKTQEKKKA